MRPITFYLNDYVSFGILDWYIDIVVKKNGYEAEIVLEHNKNYSFAEITIWRRQRIETQDHEKIVRHTITHRYYGEEAYKRYMAIRKYLEPKARQILEAEAMRHDSGPA